VGASSIGRPAGAGALPAAAERTFGEEAVAFTTLVRAVLAEELRLAAADPALEDLTQEVLRRALEGRARLVAGAPLRPWLLGITRHVAADERRRRRRHLRNVSTVSNASNVRSADDALADPETLTDPADGPGEMAARAEQVARLQAALARLPAPGRNALLLFHLDGLSYQEIARRLGVPTGTVGTWIARARAQLLIEMDEGDRR
jgi:RNA polymerase sigma factor (sigma-70 family)